MFKRKILPCNPKLIELAKKLRKQGILSEVILWNHLKGGKRFGHDFHRQKPIDNYIVDFFSPDLMLAIEIDGISHGYKFDQDEERDRRLGTLDIKVLRFTDSSVKNNLDGVLDEIDCWIKENFQTHPATEAVAPLPRGE
ncbi:MAG: endonuclease domain-containing protein [Patescibacteria group bacterium]|nr:endonuclease domain-containing protein [Patescibacteria group bacterium]